MMKTHAPAAILATTLLLGGCVPSERERQLAIVPEALRVSAVSYASEVAVGIGPGGNETGIVVYEMPVAFWRTLETEGLAHLRTLPMPLRAGSPEYDSWEETPVRAEPDWPHASSSDANHYRIRDYTDRYLTSEMDPAVETMVNEALAAPGSYYAQHMVRTQLIVIIPSERRVVFGYSG